MHIEVTDSKNGLSKYHLPQKYVCFKTFKMPAILKSKEEIKHSGIKQGYQLF